MSDMTSKSFSTSQQLIAQEKYFLHFHYDVIRMHDCTSQGMEQCYITNSPQMIALILKNIKVGHCTKG